MLGGSGIVHISKVNKQHDSASTSYENERDHLFRSILKLSNEVSEMKEFIKKHFNGQPAETPMVQHPGISIKMSDTRYIPQSDGQFISSIPQAAENTDSTDFIEVQEEVPVSMKELEMTNIKSSLDRNHGKRRKTARELGISERTLYRKIKEYNLQ